MSTLWIEPFGGMAGDMFLAALCDLGDARFGLADLSALAAKLAPGECTLELSQTSRGSFRALRLDVRTRDSARAPHRHLADLEALVLRAGLGPEAEQRARAVFRCIAAAEAKVHGTSEERVHFHEVGALDTLIDVCGAVLALERLGVERVVSAAPLVGSGHVVCEHGELPVPAPGTAEILRGLPVRMGGEGERTTPTGAALLAVLTGEFGAPGDFAPEAIGYGAGARDPRNGPPNLVRVQLGRAGVHGGLRTPAWMLEFNLDDASGQAVGFCVAELRAAGALDVWTVPCQMKKDRPGVVVTALCRAELRERLEQIAYASTTTFGLRWSACERSELAREELALELDARRVRVKLRCRPGVAEPEPADFAPEYEDLAAWARATGLPLEDLRARARAAAFEAWRAKAAAP